MEEIQAARHVCLASRLVHNGGLRGPSIARAFEVAGEIFPPGRVQHKRPFQMTPDHDDIAAVQGIKAVSTIMRVIAETTGMRWVCVAKVTADHWTLCAVHDSLEFGLGPGDRLAIEDTFCDRVRRTGQGVVIDAVTDSEEFRDHLVPKMFGFQSYFSLPVLRSDGSFFGTLCGLDPLPAKVSDPKVLDMIGLFAEMLSSQIDVDARLREAQEALEAERETVDLREQFIAVLGHDIRTPLSSIMTGAEIVAARSGDEGVLDVARRIKRSAARIATLIDDVMDFARGKLGGGLHLSPRAVADLGAVLAHVVAEARGAYPDSQIACRVAIGDPVFCDSARLAQLLSNLLVNAIVHGDSGEEVAVEAIGTNGGLRLSVSNYGPPIPPETAGRLFQPFRRGQENREPGGLGLGLYIASEIAKSHGGELRVDSTANRTVFTLTLPEQCPMQGKGKGEALSVALQSRA